MSALAICDDIGSEELRRRARRERDGRVSARLIAIANALEGMDRASAARLAGMDRQTLRDWVHRYNAHGIAGLCNRPAPGRRPKLSEGQMAALKAMVLAGPDPVVDKITRWRIVDLCRWVEERWGVSYSETGMLRLLWSLDLSHRKTRPRHPQSNEKAQQAFKKGVCCPSDGNRAVESGSRAVCRTEGTDRLCLRGHTPRGLRDVGHQSAWIIGAVCPARDTGVALVITRLDTAAMNLFLAELGQAVARGAHGIVLMDKAGWHTSGDLVVPKNLSLVFLPPYSPELNPIERLWLHLRDNRLLHGIFQTTDEIVDTCCDAWNWLLGQTGRLRSLCSYPWIERVGN